MSRCNLFDNHWRNVVHENGGSLSWDWNVLSTFKHLIVIILRNKHGVVDTPSTCDSFPFPRVHLPRCRCPLQGVWPRCSMDGHEDGSSRGCVSSGTYVDAQFDGHMGWNVCRESSDMINEGGVISRFFVNKLFKRWFLLFFNFMLTLVYYFAEGVRLVVADHDTALPLLCHYICSFYFEWTGICGFDAK